MFASEPLEVKALATTKAATWSAPRRERLVTRQGRVDDMRLSTPRCLLSCHGMCFLRAGSDRASHGVAVQFCCALENLISIIHESTCPNCSQGPFRTSRRCTHVDHILRSAMRCRSCQARVKSGTIAGSSPGHRAAVNAEKCSSQVVGFYGIVRCCQTSMIQFEGWLLHDTSAKWTVWPVKISTAACFCRSPQSRSIIRSRSVSCVRVRVGVQESDRQLVHFGSSDPVERPTVELAYGRDGVQRAKHSVVAVEKPSVDHLVTVALRNLSYG